MKTLISLLLIGFVVTVLMCVFLSPGTPVADEGSEYRHFDGPVNFVVNSMDQESVRLYQYDCRRYSTNEEGVCIDGPNEPVDVVIESAYGGLPIRVRSYLWENRFGVKVGEYNLETLAGSCITVEIPRADEWQGVVYRSQVNVTICYKDLIWYTGLRMFSR